MVQLTHVRMSSNGSRHEHIAGFRWYNPKTGEMGESDTMSMVKYVREKNRAYVCDGRRIIEVGVVEASPPYVRTHADGVWSDNLLALPRY